jgi:hypothetical protein
MNSLSLMQFYLRALVFLVAAGLFAAANSNGGGSACTGSATCRASLFAASDRHGAILAASTKAGRITAGALAIFFTLNSSSCGCTTITAPGIRGIEGATGGITVLFDASFGPCSTKVMVAGGGGGRRQCGQRY